LGYLPEKWLGGGDRSLEGARMALEAVSSGPYSGLAGQAAQAAVFLTSANDALGISDALNYAFMTMHNVGVEERRGR